MPIPQEPGAARSPLFGLPAVSVSCPRCGRLVAADALSCPRCAQPIAATVPAARTQAPVGTPAPAPAPAPAQPPTEVLGGVPDRTVQLPAPAALSTPAPAAAPSPAAAPPDLPRPPVPPPGGPGGRGRGGLVLLGAVGLVVTAVLWLVLSTVIGSARGPEAAPADGGAQSSRAAGPRVVDADLVRAAATSVQRPDGGVTYDAAKTLDDRPVTAWNSRGEGVGARLSYAFGEPVDLVGISVLNGYQKRGSSGGDLWALNERLRQVRVTTDAGSFTWSLRDVKELQTFSEALGRTDSVQIEVLSTYEGEKYEDVGLSEIKFLVDG